MPTENSPYEVFLGGACGVTTWRQDIAIPILEQAGVRYFNPQMAPGAWTPAHQYLEMEVKSQAPVWLFVLNEQTRGVASIGETAYRIGQGGGLALALTDIPYSARFEHHQPCDPREIDDLNRGRVFLRAMADEHRIPVFDSIAAAAHYAVELALKARQKRSVAALEMLVKRVHLPGFTFLCGQIGDQLTVQIQKTEVNILNGLPEPMTGRIWLIDPFATESEVLRTLLKAALTWEEHELREQFRFDGKLIFNPHSELTHDPNSGI